MSVGFNITKKEIENEVNDKDVISTVKLKVENTSNKGFAIIAIPIGDFGVKNIVINNGTANISLKENDYSNPIGWYVINDNVLKITIIKDPEINVVLAATLPSTTSTPSSSVVSSHHHHITTTTETYPDVAKDIKSEKIKELVHNVKLIIGSEIDNNLSAKCLKNTTELINQSLEIKEDCILIGGPVANPLVKKYGWAFNVRITNDYPGENKGVIQKQIINGHTVILLAGSDRWGTKATVEYFKTLDDIPDEPIFVQWKDGKAVKIEKP
jgi:hypothetical protein